MSSSASPGGRPAGQTALMRRPANRLVAQSLRDVVGDAVQPTAERIPLANGAGLASQDEKSGLKGVLGILRVSQDAAARVKHHRAVTLNERREGGFRTLGQKLFQQLLIRQNAVRLPRHQRAEMTS
jgi:hypothetical protein